MQNHYDRERCLVSTSLPRCVRLSHTHGAHIEEEGIMHRFALIVLLREATRFYQIHDDTPRMSCL
jgi:hypothetical protein